MSTQVSSAHLIPILSVQIRHEQDLVAVRQRARQVAAVLGFGQQDQTRICTAVSEVGRNAYQYAVGGRVEFLIDLRSKPQVLWIQVVDQGRGIDNLDAALEAPPNPRTGIVRGLTGATRLMDEFSITTSAEQGTRVRFSKSLPPGPRILEVSDISRLSSALAQQPTAGAAEELVRQNHDLLQALDMIRMRESELERRQHDLSRLNVELEETNRGVVALYAELDEKAAALRRADEMKSRFLSHVSHEFRTPVNSVLALTRLLLQRTDGELTSEQEKQIAYIRDAARELSEMVNDLLDLAKVESGKTDVTPTLIDVARFLGATRALMRPLATNEAVALVIEDPPQPYAFETDETKLGQIIRNLISNSLKFTQEGEVRVGVELSDSKESIVFSVRDTGIGIAPEDQERIFNEFTQIDNPIQKRVKGTGLGLPLSRRLATLLGGTLVVESAVGTGSTFRLTLPFRSASHAASLDAGSRGIYEASKTILIVDDEPSARYLAHRLFQGTQHRIIEAAGIDAAERARFDMPALVLLDLVMADRNGFQVLNDLKSDERTRDIPVVIHTSKALTLDDHARLNGSQAAILPKGVDGRLEALRTIKEILGEPFLFSTEPEFQ